MASYKRILIKLSGEMLLNVNRFGIDEMALSEVARIISTILDEGYELALVIGGGNIFRGVNLKNMQRTPADQIGMLATLMNGIALQQACQNIGINVRLISALDCPKIAETYHWGTVTADMASGYPIIFVGGTGNPYFTTDTAAALRASEIKADILLKATKVPGVFTDDPIQNSSATKYAALPYSQFLAQKLKVMDATSVVLCMESKIPIFVFSMEDLGKVSIRNLLAKPEKYGTMIH